VLLNDRASRSSRLRKVQSLDGLGDWDAVSNDQWTKLHINTRSTNQTGHLVGRRLISMQPAEGAPCQRDRAMLGCPRKFRPCPRSLATGKGIGFLRLICRAL
jgi:hypothetical protein